MVGGLKSDNPTLNHLEPSEVAEVALKTRLAFLRHLPCSFGHASIHPSIHLSIWLHMLSAPLVSPFFLKTGWSSRSPAPSLPFFFGGGVPLPKNRRNQKNKKKNLLCEPLKSGGPPRGRGPEVSLTAPSAALRFEAAACAGALGAAGARGPKRKTRGAAEPRGVLASPEVAPRFAQGSLKDLHVATS